MHDHRLIWSSTPVLILQVLITTAEPSTVQSVVAAPTYATTMSSLLPPTAAVVSITVDSSALTTAAAPLASIRAIHGSWEDASQICPAGSTLASCAFPSVSSDGMDGDTTSTMRLQVTRVYFDTSTVDVFSCNSPGTAGCTHADVVAAELFDFSSVGYYLFNYTAVDAYGNSAEDVLFSLFLDDWVEPTITEVSPALSATDIQACNPEFSTCSPVNFIGMEALDDVNGDVSGSLTYSINNGAFVQLADAQAQFGQYQFAPGTIHCGVKAHDNAGAFGKEGANNEVYGKFTFNVVDDIAPVITVNDQAASAVECCKLDYSDLNRGDDFTFASCAKYQDAGATYFDQVSGTLPVESVVSTVDIRNIGTYSVTYDASSWNGRNNAATVARNVVVQDTTPPLIALKVFPQAIVIHQYNKNTATTTDHVSDTVDNGDDNGTLDNWTAETINDQYFLSAAGLSTVQVWDECSDADLTAAVTVAYLSADEATTYPTAEEMADAPGSYIARYTATDSNGLTSTIDRIITVVDKTAPIIRITGANRIYKEIDSTFVNPGAICKDYNNVELTTTTVSDNVDTSTLGTYTIVFSCTDGENTALSQTLTVEVRDTTAPTFVMNLGDGAMTTNTALFTDHINDLQFPNGNSGSAVSICHHEIQAGFPFKDPSGVASDNIITGVTVAVSNNIASESASKAWNMESCAAIKAFYTEAADGYYFIATSKSGTVGKVRVQCNMATLDTTKSCTGSCNCQALGMTQRSDGVCTISSTTTPEGYTISHDAIVEGSKLKKGSYVYQYFITDAAGNTNDCWNHAFNQAVLHCQGATMTYIRVLTVIDTLPPVITLHNRDNHNAVLYAAEGLDNANPFVQGALMAEQSNTANGWVIAAAGCAVAGLALMAVSSKKSAHLVPV